MTQRLMAEIEKFSQAKGFRRSFATTFTLTLFVTALAKGAALLPGYSIDDYSRVLEEAPGLIQLVQQKGGLGRFGSALVSWLLDVLQLSPAHARIFFVCCWIAVSALFGALVVRFWNLDRKGWLAPAMACIVANHPYMAEILTFRSAVAIAVFPLAILSLLLLPRRWSPRTLMAGSVLFAAALSIYQMALPFGLMIVSVGAAIWLTRYLVLGASSGWPPRVVALLSLRRLAAHRNTVLLGCILLGTALYAAFTILLTLMLRVGLTARAESLPVQQWGQRSREVITQLKYRLLEPGPLLSRLTQGMLLLVLLAALLGPWLRTRAWRRPQPPLLALSILMLLLASLVWSLGVLLFLKEFWPTPRVLAHMGIFWAGALAIAYQCLGPRTRPILAVLSALIVISFIGSNNRIFNDQSRLNVRDAGKANRIIARLEQLPGFPAVTTLAVHGTQWAYPLRFETMDHDMNISAFGADWAQEDLLAEISGYNFNAAEDQAQLATAAAYCQKVEPWPGPQSVAIEGPLAIVCLGP